MMLGMHCRPAEISRRCNQRVDVAGRSLPVKPDMKSLGVDERVAARTEQPRQGSLQVQRSDGRSTFTQIAALATDP